MLTISKKDGAISTAGAAKKGDKGRLELNAFSRGDGTYGLNFKDYGNYGRIRWEASFGDLTEHSIDDMIEALQELRAGQIEDTAVEFQPPQPEPEAEAEPVEEELEDEAELSADDVEELPAELTEEPQETEQLEA
jgi:hypothetical protein